jgi:DNA repair protein RadC
MEQYPSNLALFQAAEIALVYKTNVNLADRPIVKTTEQIYGVLMSIWDAGKIELVEQFNVLLLNRGNKIIGVYRMSTGGISGTVADPRLIFAAAIKAKAQKIITSHNHPSGNLRPSREDINLTDKIQKAGILFGIKVMDHLIVTGDGYYSFKDEGSIE